MSHRSKLVLGILAVLLSACAPRHDVSLPSAESRRAVPEFTLPDRTGVSHGLSTFRGNAVVLNFWAPWCFECLAELEAFERLGAALKGDDIEFVGIAVADSEERIRATAAEKKLSRMRVLIDERDEVRARFDASILPLTMVLDREGRAVPFPDPATGEPVMSCTGARGWEIQPFVEFLQALADER